MGIFSLLRPGLHAITYCKKMGTVTIKFRDFEEGEMKKNVGVALVATPGNEENHDNEENAEGMKGL